MHKRREAEDRVPVVQADRVGLRVAAELEAAESVHLVTMEIRFTALLEILTVRSIRWGIKRVVILPVHPDFAAWEEWALSASAQILIQGQQVREVAKLVLAFQLVFLPRADALRDLLGTALLFVHALLEHVLLLGEVVQAAKLGVLRRLVRVLQPFLQYAPLLQADVQPVKTGILRQLVNVLPSSLFMLILLRLGLESECNYGRTVRLLMEPRFPRIQAMSWLAQGFVRQVPFETQPAM